ncbi:M-phase inducer phosphatase 2-like [Ostrea edulis]|uniref:M-phase inducer phosphatase 2-like n=1 Tax=Ostrea edulis TaxID=37623 RepID=UPI0024AF4944|nr:M-phase inducer phosphatase 2-like [Ostrea edulis]
MFTPERLDAVLNSDFSLGCLPKRTLFPDNNQVPCEDEDSGLGMEELERPFASISLSPSINIRRPLKRNETSTETDDGTLQKRTKFATSRRTFKKSLSFVDKTLGEQDKIKSVVGRMVEDSNIIGDGSQTCSLPTILGKHPDLKSVTNDTVVDVISGRYQHTIGSYLIIDCRYPYEYEGGHVPGAINVHRPDGIKAILDQHQSMRNTAAEKRHILIFYCEFSSERGPRMCRNVRKADRNLNKENYPFLNFPEVYIMHNGFKAFYEAHTGLCEPQGYTPMLHKEFSDDLRHFRSKSKSWSGGYKRHSVGLRLL